MATYPTVDQGTESSFVPINSNKIDISTNGIVRGRVVYTEDVFNANVIHPFISETDKDSILDFYDANKIGNGFQFERVADGLTYTLIFKARPQTKRHNATWWTVTSQMVGTEYEAPPEVTHSGITVTHLGETVTYG